MKGINGTAKCEKVEDVLKKGKLNMLAMTERKKESEKITWYAVSCTCIGV